MPNVFRHINSLFLLAALCGVVLTGCGKKEVDVGDLERLTTQLLGTKTADGEDEDLDESKVGHAPRVNAALDLGKIADPGAVSALVKALATDKEWPVRAAAAQALGNMAGKIRTDAEENQATPDTKVLGPAVAPLVNALKDRHWAVGRHAAIALGRIRDPRAVEPLIVALKGGEPGVRAAAAEALGLLGDRRAVPALLAALKEESWEATVPAVLALGKLGGVDALDALKEAMGDERPHVRAAAAAALAGTSDAAVVKLLAGALADKEPAVQAAAIEALGKSKHADAVPALVGVLGDWKLGPQVAGQLEKRKWEPASAEETARFAVARRDKDAIEDNRQSVLGVFRTDIASADRGTVTNAVYALIALGDDDIVADLTRLLDDKLDPDLAYTFAKCGKEELAEPAETWLEKQKLSTDSPRGVYVRWGSL